MLRTLIISLGLPFAAFATAPCPPFTVAGASGEPAPPCLAAWPDGEYAGVFEVHNDCAEPAEVRLIGLEHVVPTDAQDPARRTEVREDGSWVLSPGEGSVVLVDGPARDEDELLLTLEWAVGPEAGAQDWRLVGLACGGSAPEHCAAMPGADRSSGLARLLLLAAFGRRRLRRAGR